MKFGCAAVGLDKILGFLRNLPVQTAVEMLDNANIRRFFLVIAESDFERFVQLVSVIVHLEVRLTALSYQIKCIAGEDP